MLKNFKDDKIVRKALKPYLSGLAVGVTSGLIVITMLLAAPETVNGQNNEKASMTKPAMIAGTFASIIFLAALSVFYMYKNSNNFVKKSATEYIKKLTENDPEFKDFKHLLNYPDILERVANAVIKNLQPNEQNKIADIVLNFNLFNNKKDVEKACDEVISIIQNYAKTHHEDFVDEIFVEFGKESFALHVKQNQNQATLPWKKIK